MKVWQDWNGTIVNLDLVKTIKRSRSGDDYFLHFDFGDTTFISSPLSKDDLQSEIKNIIEFCGGAV